jgi:Flp pilus assembly protein TadD
MKPLEPPDSHHLRAAEGWLGLGDQAEAAQELDKIAPRLRGHPAVLRVYYDLHAKAKLWDLAAEVAGALVTAEPGDPGAWICLAYAIRRKPGSGILQAREILTRAQPMFPEQHLIPFNLACYECQLGDLEKARQWLQMAFAGNDASEMKLMALADPDLEPMWKQIGEM